MHVVLCTITSTFCGTKECGALKARFPILEQMAPYPFVVQRNVVIACFEVHKFIRKSNIDDEFFDEWDNDNIINNQAQEEVEDIGEEVHGPQWGTQSLQYMTNLWDEIAN
ncbi:unnamed protein product [Cuscuta epithymum]|uniref:Uncharacterized protein n=1 Tax=Cuscuta epithymum TaxID=186058 RepID=A0AAV0C181_9ASTE|nr:unnamed protein product [Cuscuta epithymum]